MLSGKTVLITGATGGIGAAAARLFAAEGARVALHYHSREDLARSLCRELREQGRDAACFGADLRDPEEAARLIRETEAELGPLYGLVYSAGTALQKLLQDVTAQEWRDLFALHVDGLFHCCKAALPGMISRGGGRILTVSSIWGITGASCEVPYSAAKAAVIGYTKALAKEAGPSGITVNCVAPGVIDTEMNGALSPETLALLKEETPLGILGTGEDVARSLVFLAGEGGRFITGQVLSPNGGIVI